MKEEKEQQLRIEYKQQVQKSMDLPKGSFENWFIDCMKKLEIEAHNNALKMVEEDIQDMLIHPDESPESVQRRIINLIKSK